MERDLRNRTNQIHPVEALTVWSSAKSTPYVFEVTKSTDGGGGFQALVRWRQKYVGYINLICIMPYLMTSFILQVLILYFSIRYYIILHSCPLGQNSRQSSRRRIRRDFEFGEARRGHQRPDAAGSVLSTAYFIAATTTTGNDIKNDSTLPKTAKILAVEQ